MRYCEFCNEFGSPQSSNLFTQLFGEKVLSRVVRETENFVVFPTLGQIVEGYLLIVPKQHLLSFGALSATLYPEATAIKDETKKILSMVYQPPIFFEHGPVSEHERAGCCVEHAHLHAVPVDVDLLPQLKDHFTYHAVQSDLWCALETQIRKGIPYLFFENRSGQQYIFDAPSVPSQFLRQLLARALGLEAGWDWALYIGEQELLSTLRTLSSWQANTTTI